MGCHENRRGAPVNRPTGAAMRRAASTLDGWHGEPRLFSYRAEVQPVFDRNCLNCHDFGGSAAKSVILAGDRDVTFNTSYNELWRKGLIHVVGAGPHTTQPAKSWGSTVSKLAQVVLGEHYGVKLDGESIERVLTWIDINAPYYPTYDCAYPDNLTGRCPLDDKQLARLEELTGVPLRRLASVGDNRGPQVSFDRPEQSPCLASLQGKAGYDEALGLIRAGATLLAQRPEADAPGFVACATDQRREEKYERLRQMQLRNREAVVAGTKVYDPR
jgi:hypothetical protein